jgi:hypothetical protein
MCSAAKAARRALSLAGIVVLGSITTSEAQWNGLAAGWAAVPLGFAAPYFNVPSPRPDYYTSEQLYRRPAPSYAYDPAHAYTGDPAYYGYDYEAVSSWQERRLRGSEY